MQEAHTYACLLAVWPEGPPDAEGHAKGLGMMGAVLYFVLMSVLILSGLKNFTHVSVVHVSVGTFCRRPAGIVA